MYIVSSQVDPFLVIWCRGAHHLRLEHRVTPDGRLKLIDRDKEERLIALRVDIFDLALDRLTERLLPQLPIPRLIKAFNRATYQGHILYDLSGTDLVERLQARLQNLTAEREACQRDSLAVEGLLDGKSASEKFSGSFGRLFALCEKGGMFAVIGSDQQVFEKGELPSRRHEKVQIESKFPRSLLELLAQLDRIGRFPVISKKPGTRRSDLLDERVPRAASLGGTLG